MPDRIASWVVSTIVGAYGIVLGVLYRAVGKKVDKEDCMTKQATCPMTTKLDQFIRINEEFRKDFKEWMIRIETRLNKHLEG